MPQPLLQSALLLSLNRPRSFPVSTRQKPTSTQAWKPFNDRKVRVGIVGHGVCKFGLKFELQHHPNVELVAVSDMFTSEVGLFRTAEGGLSRMIICGSQGEYLEAGRVRGEYGGFNETFRGDKVGRRRYAEALNGGLKLKKYALPPGVKLGGHGGSHGYLGHDFIDAILRSRKPRVDVLDALNMTVPGYFAHLSAMKDGETMKIPQYSI